MEERVIHHRNSLWNFGDDCYPLSNSLSDANTDMKSFHDSQMYHNHYNSLNEVSVDSHFSSTPKNDFLDHELVENVLTNDKNSKYYIGSTSTHRWPSVIHDSSYNEWLPFEQFNQEFNDEAFFCNDLIHEPNFDELSNIQENVEDIVDDSCDNPTPFTKEEKEYLTKTANELLHHNELNEVNLGQLFAQQFPNRVPCIPYVQCFVETKEKYQSIWSKWSNDDIQLLKQILFEHPKSTRNEILEMFNHQTKGTKRTYFALCKMVSKIRKDFSMNKS